MTELGMRIPDGLFSVLKAPSAACVTAPLLMLWHPAYDFAYRLRGLRHRSENYTWGKQK